MVDPPGPDAESAPTRPRNPWWLPPFLGRVPVGLPPEALSLLGLLALGLTFEQYDLSLINSAIKNVSDDLGIAVEDLGYVTGAVRLGGLLTFALVPFADRLGRRRMFLGALVGMSLCTMATAFVQTAEQFAVVQAASRGFMLTASVVAVVILVEEFPAEHRGWGLGALVAVSAWGYGLGTGIYAAVDVLPWGWRSLYVLGIMPALMLPFFRGRLRETARFQEHRAGSDDGSAGSWLRPLVALARDTPGRAAAVGVAGLLGAAGSIGVFQYLSPFVQSVHGWEPWRYSVMVIGGGLLGIIGNVIAGRLADRIGRRWVGLTAFGLYPLGVAAFYLGPSQGLVVAWVFIVFFGTAGDVVMRAVASELFPTSHRTTAMGWLTLLQTIGWSGGLMLVSVGAGEGREISGMVCAMSLLMSGAGIAFLFVPESSRRELEDVSDVTSGG